MTIVKSSQGKRHSRNRELTPDTANLLNAALELHRAGEVERARENCRFVLALVPEQPDALHLLGATLVNDQPREAEALIRQAISYDTRNSPYHSTLALALRNQQRFEEALAMYDKALRREPDFREAHYNRGLILLLLRRHEEAVAALSAALKLKADLADALKHRGDALSALGRLGEAVTDYDRALEIVPGDVNVLNNRSLALLGLKQPDEALATIELALQFAPKLAELVNTRGAALIALGRFDDALECFDRAQLLKPGYVNAIVSRGSALEELGRHEEALASYAQAIKLSPDHMLAHWNQASLMLLTGDLARGFAEAEWRYNVPSRGLRASGFKAPPWLGETSIEGKTILVHAEQGLGDTIHFARYIALLAARGARVIARVQKPLRKLIADIEGASVCIAEDDPLPRFDLHCALPSLPLAFQTTLDSIPAQIPYLKAPALKPEWRERLGPEARPKIGIVWSGYAHHERDRYRSIPLAMLEPLLASDATFISLQTELRPDDTSTMRDFSDLVAAGPFLHDFSEMSALVASLDLVITVDTSIAHLAGALGRPVWILLPVLPDWRWLLDREDSPWYPTAKLFRQGADRDWDPVIERVRRALDARIIGRQIPTDAST